MFRCFYWLRDIINAKKTKQKRQIKFRCILSACNNAYPVFLPLPLFDRFLGQSQIQQNEEETEFHMWTSSNNSEDKEFHIGNQFGFVTGIFVSEPCRTEDSAILSEVRMIANHSACQNGTLKRGSGVKPAHLLAIKAEASLALLCTERKNYLFNWPYS